MTRASEEARKRARSIRDEALAKLETRADISSAILEELGEVKNLLLAQRGELASLRAAVEALTHAEDAPIFVASKARPLSHAKRRVLERIQELRTQELSFAQICQIFQEERIPTLSGEGQWSKGTLWNLWKNHRRQL